MQLYGNQPKKGREARCPNELSTELLTYINMLFVDNL